MNILLVVPSFYDKNYKYFNKSKVGQPVIVGNICRNFSNSVKVNILITGKPTKSVKLSYANVLSTSFVRLISNFRLKYLKTIKFRGGLMKWAKSVYTFLMCKQTEVYLKNNTYDLVAIHDFTESNMEVLRLCQSFGIKSVVTLHIYIGSTHNCLNNSYKSLTKREEFLIEKTNVPITVVSTGLKKRILQDYSYIDPDRIAVIPNGTDFTQSENTTVYSCKLKEKFGSKKLFLCIGTIGERKNQIQLLKALNLLDDNIRAQIKVLFIGTDMLNGKLQKMIIDEKLTDVAVYIGALSHKELEEYYHNAYAVISTSLNEAFGLTFIEGFCFGIPSIFFYDIDSAEDLYFSDGVVMIKNKDDASIAYAITEALNKSWNNEKIKIYSKKFNISEIVKLYENEYKSIFCT